MGDECGDYDYDIALSFAGEDRALVQQLADQLVEDNIRVFYDEYEKAVLWGKDLYQHLQAVYRDRARYCIIFASAAYAAKIWPRHELKQAQARAIKEHQEYILPVRMDDTEIPGLNATVGYIDMRKHSVKALRDLIIQKVYGPEVEDEDLPELTWRGDRVEFRGTMVASFWPAKLAQAQLKTTYFVELSRIRYGDEPSGLHAAQYPCSDCGAVRGECHVPGCDMEECPVCHGQALSCDCIF